MRYLLLSAVLLTGCGTAMETAGEDGRSPDAGSGVGADGSPPTNPDDGAGLPADYATPERAEGPDSSETGGSPSVAACFGSAAEPAFFECDAALLATCADLRSCCVGDGTCCSAVSAGPLPDELAFTECADGDAALCLGGGVTPFGNPQPHVRSGALLPNGDAEYDSGLLVGGPVDLTSHRVELSPVFAAPSDCASTCLEGVAVGFTSQAVLDDTSHVRLSVGLLYSGGRDQVGLVIGGEIVQRWALADAQEKWTLVVRPDGVAEVHRGDERAPVVEADFAPAANAQLVVHGRNENRPADAPLGARLLSLGLATSLCDMPQSWPEREPVALGSAGTAWDPAFVEAPSIAYDDAGAGLLAFVHGQNILVAQRPSGGDATAFEVVGSMDVSVVHTETGTTARDPELVATPGGSFVLFHTLEEGESASIGRADGDASGFTPTSDAVIKPGTPGFEGFTRIEQPTVHVHYTGVWVMVARTTRADGTTQLTPFQSTDDGFTWSVRRDGDLAALTSLGGAAADGFDADELAHPSLIVHDGAWQLYYAGRRGTRWGIGLLLSDELLRWRSVGNVLAGDGNGFDRLGVGAPDAASHTDAVELLFQGSDGARERLGRAWRRASDQGARF